MAGPVGKGYGRRMRRRTRPGLAARGLITGAVVLMGGTLVAGPLAEAATTITPVTQASTSTRGVTSTQINVVFPVVNLQALSTQLGFAGDVEYTEQGKAISLFVQHINDHGGINGRKINPIITFFDPTNDANMQALCRDWTEGSPGAFAVLDGVGAFSGDAQLCVTQLGHTPFLGQWTTVSSWTTRPAAALPVVDGTRRRRHPGRKRW